MSFANVRKGNIMRKFTFEQILGFSSGALILTLSVVSQFLPQGPESDASVASIYQYFQQHQSGILANALLTALRGVLLLVFAAALTSRLDRADSSSRVLAAITFGSGIVVATSVILGNLFWAVAATKFTQLEPSVIQGFFIANDVVFYFMLLPMVTFLVAAAASILIENTLPRWTGYGAFVPAILLLLGEQAFFADEPETPLGIGADLGIVLFVIWIAAVGIMMLRQATEGSQPAQEAVPATV
jgi:hypothetical protein